MASLYLIIWILGILNQFSTVHPGLYQQDYVYLSALSRNCSESSSSIVWTVERAGFPGEDTPVACSTSTDPGSGTLKKCNYFCSGNESVALLSRLLKGQPRLSVIHIAVASQRVTSIGDDLRTILQFHDAHVFLGIGGARVSHISNLEMEFEGQLSAGEICPERGKGRRYNSAGLVFYPDSQLQECGEVIGAGSSDDTAGSIYDNL